LLLDPPGGGRAAVLFLLDPLGGGALAPGVAKRRAGGGKNERRVAALLLLDPLVGGALAPARWRGSRSWRGWAMVTDPFTMDIVTSQNFGM
jgi:hypothetical protein